VALLVVVVGAEVVVAHAGIGEQDVEDAHLGVAEGYVGLGRPGPAGDAPVAGALTGLGLAGRGGGLAGDGADVPVAVLAPGAAGALAGLAGPPGPGGPGRPGGGGGVTGHVRARSL